jgi:SAM-dependent methyltransferase
MPKRGEIDYIQNIGPEAVRHAQHKPFSDPECGRYLMDLGAVVSLLPPPPARVLDLGCGTGWTSVLLARRGYDVVGQDIAPDMIELAEGNRDSAGPLSLRFTVCDYEHLPFDSEFDAALFYDALHHAEDERQALAGVFRALRPDGICLTVEPGTGHARAAVAVAQRFGVTEKDMPPARVVSLGRECGFRAFRIYRRPALLPELLEPDHRPGGWQSVRYRLRQLAKGVIGPWWERRQALHGHHIVWMRK